MNLAKRYWWLIGLLLALAVVLLSPLASAHPDGLERVAEDEQFIDRARDAPYEVLPGYAMPGVGNENTANILAGLVGTVLVFGLTYGLAWVLSKRSRGLAP